jgi:hypothetical protein
VLLGQGSSLFIFARVWTAAGRQTSAYPTHPASGLSLVTIDDGDPAGQELVDLERGSVADLAQDAWAACNIRLTPGAYRLRLRVPGSETIEQTVVASPDWQTQVFLLQRHYDASAGESLRESAGAEPGARPTGVRPDLTGASVVMARDGFAKNSIATRHAELARLGLIGRRRVVPREVREILRDKYDNPMLGIFGAHLLLMEPNPDRDLLGIVVSNLRGMIGPHPDVEAIALALDPGRPQPFRVPPMLRQSWSQIVQATARRPELIPSDSFTNAVADRMVREDPWLVWRSPTEPIVESDDEPSALESVVESYLRPRRTTGRRRGPTMRSMGTLESLSFDAAAVESESMELDDAKMSALVESLQLPRSQLEQLVEKVRRRPRASE